jgi:glutathione S-transferase
MLFQQHQFLGHARRNATDIAIFPFIRQFAATDQSWFDAQPVPALQIWLGTLLALPVFEKSMGKYAQWKQGDEVIWFP